MFSIVFVPFIPQGNCNYKEIPKHFSYLSDVFSNGSFSQVDVEIIIDNRSFSYYPADGEIVLTDLMHEVAQIESGIDHEFSLSGYPVLLVGMADGVIEFRDLEPSGGWVKKLDAIVVRDEFKRRASDLWAAGRSSFQS